MPDLVYVLLTVVVVALLVLVAGALDRYLSSDLTPDHAAAPATDRTADPSSDRPADQVAR